MNELDPDECRIDYTIDVDGKPEEYSIVLGLVRGVAIFISRCPGKYTIRRYTNARMSIHVEMGTWDLKIRDTVRVTDTSSDTSIGLVWEVRQT